MKLLLTEAQDEMYANDMRFQQHWGQATLLRQSLRPDPLYYKTFLRPDTYYAPTSSVVHNDLFARAPMNCMPTSFSPLLPAALQRGHMYHDK